jgi:hypothetical protein
MQGSDGATRVILADNAVADLATTDGRRRPAMAASASDG